jgi:opacity protein-like surface antigen
MKHKTKILTNLAALATLTSFASIAQSNNINEPGFYLGANYGYLRVGGDDNFDDDKDVLEALAGYRFNQYFALEGSFIDFGDYGTNLAKVSTDGYTAAIKGTLPVSDSFSLFVKLGQLWSETDYRALNFSGSADDESLFVGGGLAFKLNNNMVINATYSVYDANMDFDNVDDENFDTDFKQASVGIEYRF